MRIVEVPVGASRSSVRNNGTLVLSNGKPQKNGTDNGTAGRNVDLGGRIRVLQEGRLRKVLLMVASNPSRKIHDLAVECNLSQSHLQHLVKLHTGFALGRLLTEQRMQRAADFLAHTNLSIKQIACTVGYEHTSSFTRAFERHFRQAPRSYRQTTRSAQELTDQRVG